MDSHERVSTNRDQAFPILPGTFPARGRPRSQATATAASFLESPSLWPIIPVMDRIRIATRGSLLARWQAEHVAGRLERLHDGLRAELVTVTTQGDIWLEAPLAALGGKGLFVERLEQTMREGRADIAVHSMKDVPVELPDDFELPVLCPREDPRDALVSDSRSGLDDLPAGSVVGTSSLRRQCQLLALRPDCVVRNLRGNVDTRLRRLDAGDFDAVVLAAAGLRRLGWEDRVSEYLGHERFVPAAGQGVMGIECRAGDCAVRSLVAPLHDAKAAAEVAAERAMNRRLGGNCQLPIAAFAKASEGELYLWGLVGRADGTRMIRVLKAGCEDAPETLGETAAEELLDRGAGDVIAEALSGV